jgi:hypothetical protein
MNKNLRLIAFSALMLLAIAAIALGVTLGGAPTSAGLQQGSGAAGPDTALGIAASEPYKAEGIWAQPAEEQTYPNGVRVVKETKHDTSQPMRDIVPGPTQPRARAEIEHKLPFPIPEVNVVDKVVQTHFGAMAMPTPQLVFEGIGFPQSVCNCAPPDTNGDVGPNHYVQTVNVAYAVWDKNGTQLQAPRAINSIWTGFGGPCEIENDGDPNVLYDQQADRWLINQFTTSPPYNQCIAISTTGDPTGSYHRYAFQTSLTDFYDYQKFAVWPDAYYMTANVFEGDGGFRPSAAAFDRARMLNGQAATYQEFNPGNFYGNLLPSDLDGATPPPAGTPNFFASQSGTADRIRLWEFHVDWTTPANSTFTGPENIVVAPFDPNLCGGAPCVPQPSTSSRLDTLLDRPMHRMAYRNFGGHDTLLINHSVDVGADRAGVRWYELRSTPGAGNFGVYQQGTFAPADGLHRWMGSMAMDGEGNIAIGYSTSSSTQFPSIHYAGRLVTDPPGTLGQGEALMHMGTGSQTGTSNRWGDYSGMVIDPSDDCTFWYTTEYYQTTSAFNWRTKVGKFAFPECGGPPPPTATPGTPTATAMPTSTPGPACGQYTFTSGTGTFVTATGPELGVRCDDCAVYITLPFPVQLYDQFFTNGFVSSNGVLSLGSGEFPFGNACLPVPVHPYSILAYWDDLDTRTTACSTCGVFPEIQGTAPNRTYILEWRTEVLNNNGTPAIFEIVLHENTNAFEIIYSNIVNGTSDRTIGVQRDSGNFTQVACSALPILPNTQYSFSQPCFQITPTVPVPTATQPAPTNTPGAVTVTPTACTITFDDVPPNHTFYNDIRCLACRGVLGGYADGTFRPGNDITRGQISKVVSNAAGFSEPVGGQTYEDVPPSNTFYEWIERLSGRGIMGGYACGGPLEPCVPPGNRPYFRPGASATRGQLSKIVANAANIQDPVSGQFYEDVPPSHTFYLEIMRLTQRGVMSGYACGGPGEPCVPPGNRPYFRPFANVTRGQASKIVANTFFPGCVTPQRR